MTYSFKQFINLTLPILLVLLLGTPTQATPIIDTTALVGSTAGSFSVNQGAANYAIPITVPPGIAGMQPELSINYNSNTGNGQLGIGFSLGGLSIIHRCAKTIATDGIKGGVNYDSNDRYCLDGQRLIAISGTDGQSGSEYRTEINNFSKVKYNGNHWTVQTKSGQTFEYGNTPDSKIEAQGKSVVRLWTVNKITDAANNTINYIYNEDNANGEYTLSRINYTNNSVRLTYEDRNDTHTSYQAGGKLRQTKRLSNITTYANNNSIRTYDLEYRYQYLSRPKRSQLTSIEECVNGQCLPKTEFKWQYDIGNGFDSGGQQWQNDLGDDWKNRPIHEGGKHSTLIDMNGDGLPEHVFDRNSKNNQQGIYVHHNTSYSFHPGRQWQNDLGDDWKNHPIHEGGKHSTLIDMNGDGLPDRVFDRNPSNDQQGIYVYLNTGRGFDSGQQWQNDLGDDWKNHPIHEGGEYTTLIDMNGDGLPDRVFDRNPSNDQQGIYVCLNTGSGFDSGKKWQNDLGDDWKNHPIHEGGEYTTLIDMNGDGLPDRVFDRNPSNNQQGTYVFLNLASTLKLKSITNGFGIKTTINYKPLTYPTVYHRPNSSYPNISIQNAHQVVSRVTTDNAIGGKNTTTYVYGGAKANAKGRGNLGFAWIRKKDLQSNKKTYTTYNQTYPYIGQITSTKEYIKTNISSMKVLNSQTNTYHNKSSFNNKVHSPYLSQSIEKSFSFNSRNLLTTITTNQSNIDNYGNVGTIKVTTTGNNKTFTKTTQNTYSNNATHWHLGRLTASTVTHKAPNTPNISRSSNFTYNNKGLLTSETIEPNTNKALTTTYEYDNFGNKTKATTSANGITNRNTTTKYSADGKFPIKTTNALGHSENKTFDAKTGNILTLTGPNALTTT
ncbi:Rhs family protein [uncultured Candidatus Thioglobus sp.]|nr:Rhs family protein [uncultured Candidatus Thioglobus sp.]